MPKKKKRVGDGSAGAMLGRLEAATQRAGSIPHNRATRRALEAMDQTTSSDDDGPESDETAAIMRANAQAMGVAPASAARIVAKLRGAIEREARTAAADSACMDTSM